MRRLVTPVLAEALDVRRVRCAEPRRQESLERTAERLDALAAEYLFRRVIEDHYALCLVDGDDRVHGGIDDHRQPRLSCVEPLPAAPCHASPGGQG